MKMSKNSMYTYMYVCMLYQNVCTYTQTYVYNVCVYVFMYIYIRTCMYICSMYGWMDGCMYNVCMYLCMYVIKPTLFFLSFCFSSFLSSLLFCCFFYLFILLIYFEAPVCVLCVCVFCSFLFFSFLFFSVLFCSVLLFFQCVVQTTHSALLFLHKEMVASQDQPQSGANISSLDHHSFIHHTLIFSIRSCTFLVSDSQWAHMQLSIFCYETSIFYFHFMFTLCIHCSGLSSMGHLYKCANT